MKKENTATRLKYIMDTRALRQVDILNLTLPYCKRYNVKMNKSDISQYCSGKAEPNQDKLFVLSEALGVNEAWLMGYDVPMERKHNIYFNDTPDDTPYNSGLQKLQQKEAATLTPEEADAIINELPNTIKHIPEAFNHYGNELVKYYSPILQYYGKLNELGKKEAAKRVEELSYIPQYTSTTEPDQNNEVMLDAAHTRTDIELPEDEDTSDDDIMDNEDNWK